MISWFSPLLIDPVWDVSLGFSSSIQPHILGVLTDFYCVCPPFPLPSWCKKIVGLNDTAIVIMYVICHLAPSVLVCKSSGKMGVLDLYASSAFPHNTLWGISWTDRKVWSFQGLKQSHDTEQWQWSSILRSITHYASPDPRFKWESPEERTLACKERCVCPVGRQLWAAQYCNILDKITERKFVLGISII